MSAEETLTASTLAKAAASPLNGSEVVRVIKDDLAYKTTTAAIALLGQGQGPTGPTGATGAIGPAGSGGQYIPAYPYGYRTVTTDVDGYVVSGTKMNEGAIGPTLPSQSVAYYSGGNIIAADPSGPSTAVYGTPNWTGGPTISLLGTSANPEGMARVTIDRPHFGSVGTFDLDPTYGLAPYDQDTIICIISDGQSLSLGTQGNNPVTFLPGYMNAWMTARNNVDTGVRMGVYPDWDTALVGPVDTATLLGFTPLAPTTLMQVSSTLYRTFGESILERGIYTLSNYWYNINRQRVPILGASCGIGGITIDNLQKTGAANIPNGATITAYQNKMAIITKLTELADAQSKRLLVLGVMWKHGETSSSDPNYQTKFAQLISDSNADIKAITGQQHTPIWVCTPPGACAGTDGYQYSRNAHVALHQAGTIHIAAPDYPILGRNGFAATLTSTDYVHMNATGYAIQGEWMARQLLSVWSRNYRNPVLLPVSATRSGVTVDVTFDVPVGDLTIDGSPGWTDPGQSGVTYADASGPGAPTVSSFAITGATTGRVTLSADPGARTGKVIRFGLGGPNVGSAFTATNYGRTMLRDQAQVLSTVDDVSAYNWMIPSQVSTN